MGAMEPCLLKPAPIRAWPTPQSVESSLSRPTHQQHSRTSSTSSTSSATTKVVRLHGYGTRANLPGVWRLALDRCLAFDMSQRGEQRAGRTNQSGSRLASPTPQRMGRLQGLAGPTAASL
ncbi:hypothetical protein M441DRAFT_454126 [Trichoderma asperellum CBS 433.97]|uniref:Uncharacterized protein n=1 Tax=Trichoderma asperellum (strain ATCC 204424 / CBS 433.97 / NBRC 101777) TaxID=1042311 RepID=A0A2T3ZI90_TRIA4|nr:hypothetical protein M441DRAFT_454126 [Trichoderma asperellum CBS 433.97]PTB44517.1 hypothetical protein M441DRAFT_454126 [Trichoderma asperellum CBS 433.97]